MDKQDLEKRIKALEDNQIKVNMSYNADMNIYRAVQRVLKNNALNIGSSETISANYSALLVLESITKGLLFPRMTTTQRDAIVNPIAGLVIYNTTTNVLNFHNGTLWAAV